MSNASPWVGSPKQLPTIDDQKSFRQTQGSSPCYMKQMVLGPPMGEVDDTMCRLVGGCMSSSFGGEVGWREVVMGSGQRWCRSEVGRGWGDSRWRAGGEGEW